MSIDVTIRGAGAFGLACGWALARRGAKVRVVDPGGVGAGASGGIVGALAPHVPEQWNDKKAFQLDSLLMAGEWWAGVAEAGGGDPSYRRTGRLQPIPDAAALARAQERAAGAEALWQGRASWTVEDAPESWSPGTPQVIRDTLSARLHPRRACEALAAAIRARGGDIVAEAPPQGLILHATGWRGLAEMRDVSDRPAGNGVKGQAILLDLDRRDAPQLYAAGLHIVPHADGTTAIGSTSERAFDTADTTDTQLDAVLAAAVSAVPELAGAPVLARWAGVRPRARSRAPLLGPWPGHPGEFVANGGFKIGFGMAPKVAESVADLMLEDHDTIPPAFGTSDLAPRHGKD
ncbi:Hydrogen cyanide synthase subunit HcnC precursor [Jannaschia seosinensis]|uniref:Hydrogen cyanide synthase subunit HcnC n=1 Tax=Jannaschia seosinensis TaxID=313367 RepID=A0A0M7B8J7_9RHOB|nr:FAD-dependent oxidoreductase [Jannaschia seosinensis]CUH14723.1 Hydrogen cyanide synthase subunit HcnC precursor [Jannaschia seosinensis]